MARCQNCGAFVTDAYARVFTPSGVDQPRACPDCPDKIRDGAEIRDARSPRRTDQDTDAVGYDTAHAAGGDD